MTGKTRKRAWGVIILLFGIFCFVFFKLSKFTNRDHEYLSEIQVKFGFAIQNTTGEVIPTAKLWVAAPVEKHAFIETRKIDCSIPYTLNKMNSGNQVLEFEIKNLPPYAVRNILISADLGISSRPNKIPEDRLEDYLSPEPFVESDDQDIRACAGKLKAKRNPETVANIYKFVSDHIKGDSYVANVRGASYALKYQKGDCTEYASLFTALCRANGIPARMIGGYVTKANAVLKYAGYHNWAEVWLKGRWRVADCQKRQFMENESDYIPIQIIVPGGNSPVPSYQRFACSAKGMKVKMNR